jgi:uncharacterized BrkB/YihY/UPF0761 family membrane protein
VDWMNRQLGRIDRWQRRHKVPAVLWAVQTKVSDDNANLWVVALGWYGFTAIFPLLLVLVTALGYLGAAKLGSDIVSTLQQFPIIGPDLQVGAGGSNLRGNILGVIIGLGGLFYGAQGVTQTAEQTMDAVWNVPKVQRPGFFPALLRSVGGLLVIGITFLVNAFVSGYATGDGRSWLLRGPVIAALLALNVAAYLLSFRVLTVAHRDVKALLPGAVLGGAAFTVFITVGTGLVEHLLKNESNTYGTFGTVIGIVTFLLLLAKISVYAAELNPVLERQLYPRKFIVGEATDADQRVLRDIAHQERRTDTQRIGVGFGDHAAQEAARDAHHQPGDDSTTRTNQEPISHPVD